MKKIVLAVAFILSAFSMQAQEVTQIEIVRNNPNELGTFVDKDITFLKGIISIDNKTQNAMEDLMYYKYKRLTDSSITGDEVGQMAGDIVERMKIVLGSNYARVAAKEKAIPYLSGRVYIVGN